MGEKEALQPEAVVEEQAVGEDAAEAVETCEDTAESRESESELKEAERQYEELAAQYVRLRADFDNYRRRSRQEVEDLSQRATEGLIRKLLPILDDLDRALEAASDSGSNAGLLEGVRMVQRALLDALGSEGLERVPGVGAPFDPRWHEAVARDESADDELFVVAEFQKGYSLAGRLLRPAMVKVGPAPENTTC